MLHDHAAHPIRRTINYGIQIGADVRDHRYRCIEQVNPDATEFVGAHAPTARIAKPHHDTPDLVAVARQNEPQPAHGVVGQGDRHRESDALDIDVHI